MEGKSPLASKTNWLGLLMAVAPFIPGVQPWIIANPDLAAMAAGALTIVCRAVTGQPINWKVLGG